MTDDGRVREFVTAFETLRAEVEKVIVGHREIINHVLIGMFAGGHVLLEGVPGLGKTLLVKTLSESLELSFRADPVHARPDARRHHRHEHHRRGRGRGGSTSSSSRARSSPRRAGRWRSTARRPKTQSALLEGMQEASVTVGGVSRPLPAPFSCSPPRTRSRWRARIRYRRRNSTGSS